MNFCVIKNSYFANLCEKIVQFCFNKAFIKNRIHGNYQETKHLNLIKQQKNCSPQLNYFVGGCIESRKNYLLQNSNNQGFYTIRSKLDEIKNEYNEILSTPNKKNKNEHFDFSSSTTKFTQNTARSKITCNDFTPESQTKFQIFPHPYTLNNHLNSQKSIKIESGNYEKKINLVKSIIPTLDLSSAEKRNSDLLTYRENFHLINGNKSNKELKLIENKLELLERKKKLREDWIKVNMLLLSAAHDRIIQNTKIKMEMLTFYTQNSKSENKIQRKFHIIEEGSFGKVYKGRYNHLDVAVKIPNFPTMETDPIGVTDRILREWRLLARIKHPNIIGFQGGIILPNRHIWLITDFVDGCDLHSLKYKYKESIPIEKSFRMIKQLIHVIKFLHTPTKEKGIIIHRDIKPENIIIDKKNWNMYLCDFGDAEEFGSGNKRKISGATWLYSPVELLSADPIGKEISVHKISQYNEKWDIWSLGCVLQEFFGYANPFEYIVQYSDSPNEIYSKLVKAAKENRYKPYIPQHIHPLLKRIIQICLHPNPHLRPSANNILNMLENKKFIEYFT